MRLAGTIPGFVATYICNSGFVLVGSKTRTCQNNGQWTETAPTCQGRERGEGREGVGEMKVNREGRRMRENLNYLIFLCALCNHKLIGVTVCR